MKKKMMLTCLLFAITVLSACSNNSTEEPNKEGVLSVYTTVYPLMYLTEQIGGEYVDVQSVYPAGADEHTFEPTQKNIINMAKSDLFLYIGHNLEGFVSNAKSILEDEGVKMAAIGERLDLEHIKSATNEDEAGYDHEQEEAHDHEKDSADDHADHNHGDVDPHIWLDPLLTIDMATEIKNELVQLMPEQETSFEENYQQLVTKLEELNDAFIETAEHATKHEIIVSHAAYGYWEQRYGIEEIAVSGLSSSSEPSQKQLQNIMETAKEHDIKYVLFEQNISSKLTEIIQKEIGAKALQVHNLSVLTEADIENNEDYFTLMYKNIETLQKALQ